MREEGIGVGEEGGGGRRGGRTRDPCDSTYTWPLCDPFTAAGRPAF